MPHEFDFADVFPRWMADWQKQIDEMRKQMDKPLRVVDDMIAQEHPEEADALGRSTPAVVERLQEGTAIDYEVSDVRPELEVYRNRGGQE